MEVIKRIAEGNREVVNEIRAKAKRQIDDANCQD
jgi:hypothetical protein